MSSTLNWDMKCLKRKSKKPMELYFLTLHDCNVTSMSSLNTFEANDMQSISLGMLRFMRMLFLAPKF